MTLRLIEEKLSTVRKIDRAYVRAKILATGGPRIWKFTVWVVSVRN